jgi:hypothetical protein
MVVPAELADLETEGWYAITILFFLQEAPSNQYQQPRPDGSTPDSATLAEKRPIAIIAQSPCWFCCICSFTMWATILLVSIQTPITFLNCCSLVAWHQSAWVSYPAKISVLNLRQSLFNWLIFVSFVKIPRLLKFSIIMQMQSYGFSRGASHMLACAQNPQSAGRPDFGFHFLCTDIWYTCWKSLQSQEGHCQQFGCWIPCWRIYEIVTKTSNAQLRLHRNYSLWSRNCAIRVTHFVHPISHKYSNGKKPIFASL